MAEKSKPSIEDEFILRCIRDFANKKRSFGENYVSNNMNWNSILRKALFHQIFPFLYEHLIENEIYMPSTAMEKSKRLYLTCYTRSLNLHHELQEILKVFHDENIETIPLKGAALSYTLYASPLRLHGDIDLLVKKEQIIKVHKSLLRMGYEIGEASGYLLRHSYALGYRKRCTGIYVDVDVHWDFFPAPSAYSLDIGRIWQNSERATIACTENQTMSDEDYILLLSIRAFEDLLSQRYIRLVNLLDIYMITRQKWRTTDWNYVVENGCNSGLSLPISVAWVYTAKLLGANFPSNALEEILQDAEKSLTSFHRKLFLFLLRGKLFTFPTNGVLPEFSERHVSRRTRYRILQLLLLRSWHDRCLWLEKYLLRGTSLLIRKLNFLYRRN